MNKWRKNTIKQGTERKDDYYIMGDYDKAYIDYKPIYSNAGFKSMVNYQFSKEDLDGIKLNYAIENLSLTEITYFVPDKTKAGGSYKSITGRIKKWGEYDNTLVLKDCKIIPIDHIAEIEIKDSNIEF